MPTSKFLTSAIGLAVLAATSGAQAKTLAAEELAAYRAAFEHCMSADPETEWKAIAARQCAGEKSTCEESGVCTLTCNCTPSAGLLAYHLQNEPAAWQVVTPLFEDAFADRAQRERALDVLAFAHLDPAARKLAEGFFAKDKKAFTRDQVLSFAEAGSTVLTEEAAARAKKDVRCAALAGDPKEAGVARLLEQAVERGLSDDKSLLDAFVAAAALKRAGQVEHWNRLAERVHEEVLRALDDGAIERARDLALAAEFAVKGLSAGRGYGLSYLESRLAFHRSVRSGELAQADQIFERIESLFA